MSWLLDHTSIEVTTSQSPLSVESDGWSRTLHIDGKPAYNLGVICETCAFLFERLTGATQTFSVATLTQQLREGVTDLNAEVLQPLQPLLPPGKYEVLLLQVQPQLVVPNAAEDYFCQEQVHLWGIDAFWGLPHYPHTEYYRTLSKHIGNEQALFEFVVPMVPHGWLHRDEVTAYQAALEQQQAPTAFALSYLDVKQPAMWEGEPTITKHWCLTHLLLDGHHKLYAAALARQPLTLIAFLNLSASVAQRTEIEELLTILAPAQFST